MKKIKLILIMGMIPTLAIAQAQDDDFISQITENWSGRLGFLAFVFSVVAIIMQLTASRRSSKKNAASREEFTSLKHKLSWLDNNLNKTQDVPFNINKLEERLKLLEDNIAKPEPQLREYSWSGRSDKKMEPVIEQVAPDQQPVSETLKPAQELVYAKFANLDEGFGPDIITTAQNGEQVYEIEITGDTAVFRIANDLDAQRYALAEPAYTLSKACEQLNQPFKGCRIVLHREGTLVKISGNWIIQQKAKIEFK